MSSLTARFMYADDKEPLVVEIPQLGFDITKKFVQAARYLLLHGFPDSEEERRNIAYMEVIQGDERRFAVFCDTINLIASLEEVEQAMEGKLEDKTKFIYDAPIEVLKKIHDLMKTHEASHVVLACPWGTSRALPLTEPGNEHAFPLFEDAIAINLHTLTVFHPEERRATPKMRDQMRRKMSRSNTASL